MRSPIVFALPLLACAACALDTATDSEDLANHSTVEVWITSDPAHAFRHHTGADDADRSLGAPVANVPTIDVVDDAAHQRQEVEGFGAALTDASAALMWKELDGKERSALLEKLISPTKGLGLSMLRLPIAASDSTWNGRYSYDDGPADPSLSRFSLAHDDQYIVPILKEMLQIDSKVHIIATPWSPPAWMKTNDSMIGGNLKSEYRQAYADYFVKFVRGYWQRGIPIHAVTPQNEPGQPANYPSMTLTPSEEADFVANDLAPALAHAHFDWVKVLGFDHNWGDSYPMNLLANGAARSQLDGIAFHCYGGDHSGAMSALHAKYPNKDIYLTECDRSETPKGENAGHDEGIQKLIRAMNNWSRTYMAWQLALHPDGTPNQGTGCMHFDSHGNVIWHCVGVVSIRNHAVTDEWDYAYLGHASKFVKRGARAVHVDPVGAVESVAFVNPDGSRVLVAYNASQSAEKIQVRWHGQAFEATIPKRSAATYVW